MLSDSIITCAQAGEQGMGLDAPESSMSGHYTLKSDVYRFGVVMLELMTGRKPFDRYLFFFIFGENFTN